MRQAVNHQRGSKGITVKGLMVGLAHFSQRYYLCVKTRFNLMTPSVVRV
jgi:hypothetical protein